MTDSQHNIEAEEYLLGALMFSGDALDLVPSLKPEHFFEPLHGALYGKIRELVRDGWNADPVLLANAMATDDRLSSAGGIRFLADLVGSAPPAKLVPDYARTIIDNALRRELMARGAHLQHMAANDRERSAEAIAAEAERGIADAVEAGSEAHHLTSGADVIDDAMEHASKFASAPEFTSGLVELDQMLGGFQRGELTLLAGRPGMGKSIGGLNFAKSIALAGAGVCYFSLEMSSRALGSRLACDLSFQRGGYGRYSGGPRMADIAKGEASPADLAAIRQSRDRIAAAPLRLDCRPGLTVARIEQAARRQFREWRRQGVEPGPIFVDHLGLVSPERDRKGSRHAETADVSRDLAELAKRLDVPVIALCQLNREVEGREDKRPQLSDLRQAGELEQDARMVILLLRPAYYFKEPTRKESFEEKAERMAREAGEANLLRLIVAKNSNGPTGEVEAFVDVSRSALRDRDALP